MKRLKLLAAIAVLGIPLAACEETTPPPPVGSIVGSVSIEGTGIDGVSVNLSNGNTTTTAGGGSYRFDNVEGGAYTVTISGHPSDATFDATSAAATISSAGQSVTVNFSGAYIRTASVMGTVTVENVGLGGVAVALSGVSGATTTTDDNGQYAFTGLRMGAYSVEISGFDSDEVGFSNTAASVTVGVGESKIISFDGTYLRTAGIMGTVSVDGEGIPNVTVSLAGGPDNADMTTMTDAAGQYSFAKLRAGDYAVGISGYDTDEYEFEVTSQNVTVALGETATVPFEGVLLRTSGISGRVHVEGIGFEGATVTLSMADAEDMTTMTDAVGVYAFAGLAAGDYTVAISGYDEEAFVFEVTSQDVTVGDDDTQIVNFEGEHARTASVSGMLFIDEAAKNDSFDEGEHPFPAPHIPVVLVGPGVNDQMPMATNEMGQFSFMGLKAGDYHLVVAITPEVQAALGDFAYGGSATGYPIELGVGQAHTQNLPFDITHQTVSFSAMLRHGEMTGDALPGATVNLYADLMGQNMVGTGETGDDGMATIKIARAGTSGNTVYAAVAADDYHVAEGMQAVMWDPQYPMVPAANEADIVNLMAEVTFGGATITTDFGGGDALAEWSIDISMMGEDGELVAVEGAPEALDEEGMASFTSMVEVDNLPMTYTIALGEDQEDAMDGGESYEGTVVEYTHDGLALAGAQDGGTLEAMYTTQTLKVYVHEDEDQIHGFTGSILSGDARVSGMVDVGVRYIDDNGRSRAFASDVWSKGKSTFSDAKGVVTFSGLPADQRIIATADIADDVENIMIVGDDELAAYYNPADDAHDDPENTDIVGGAFGPGGGFNHTVELCPLMASDRSGRGECGSFAFVSTYSVSGLVWKRAVTMDPVGDGFKMGEEMGDPTFVAGISVSLDPVEGKNLAGDAESYTSAAENDKDTPLDETHEFDFGQMAAGVYEITLTDDWRARMGAKGTEDMLGNALSPLGSDVVIDVTPATGLVYGRVSDSEGFPVADATVTVNNVTATTDAHGRYIAEGVKPATRRIRNVWYRNMIFVETAHEGNKATGPLPALVFAANSPVEKNIGLSGVGKTASISGTVTAANSNAAIAGAEILVDGVAPNNAATRGPNAGKLVTDADGTYEAIITAKGAGETAEVSVRRPGMSFVPASQHVLASGEVPVQANFTGFLHATISGRVKDPDGNAMAGVMVTATVVDGTEPTDSHTTTARGTFSLSVPYGTYDIEASADAYSFSYPNSNQRVSVNAGQSMSFGDIQATAVPSSDASLSSLSVNDETTEPDADGSYATDVENGVDMATIAATATQADATVSYNPSDGDDSDGSTIALVVGPNTITVTVTATDGTTRNYTVTVTRAAAPVIDDATLSALSLSDVSLQPTFEAAITSYTATVGYGDKETTVDATPTSSAATVAIIPADADMGTEGHQVTLPVGRTVITVRVTAADGTTEKDYTVAVTRDAAPSSDAALSGLDLSNVTLAPAFSPGGLNYAASVGNEVAQTMVMATQRHSAATVAIMPGDDDEAAAGHQVNLDVGNTDIMVRVTAEDGTEQTYTVTVTRAPPSDVSLSSLSVNDEDIEAGAGGNYATDVATDVEMATVAATATHADATVSYDPSDGDDSDGSTIDLEVGANTITVTVTATKGTSRDYTVTVNRAAPPATPAILIDKEEVVLTEGDSATYMVSLATKPTEDVTITITLTAGDADSNLTDDVGAMTLSTTSRSFTPSNWNIAQDVTVTANEDTDATDPAEITLTHTATIADTDYEGKTATVKVTITDDDAADAGLTITGGPLTIDEGDADGDTYMVRLAAVPDGDVVVSIAAGEDDTDVVVTPRSLTFTTGNWEDDQEVTVTAPDNDVDEADGSGATLTHSAEGGGYGDATDVTVTVTVTDDDLAAVVITDLAGREVVEGGSIGYEVKLATRPTGNVNILVNSDGVHNAVFTFTAQNWNQAQAQTVTVPEDDDTDQRTVSLAITVGGYTDGAGVPVEHGNVAFTVKDNDVAGVIVSHTALSIAAGGTGAYTVSLTQAPADGETVTITIASIGQISINPLTVELDTNNWEAGESVTLGPLAQATGSIPVTNAVTSDAEADDTEFDTATATNVTVTVTSS